MLLCVLLPARPAAAQIPKGNLQIELEPIASGLAAPVAVTHAADGSGRLFIVEQAGQILIWSGGAVLPTPFLDISGLLPTLNAFFDERGRVLRKNRQQEESEHERRT